VLGHSLIEVTHGLGILLENRGGRSVGGLVVGLDLLLPLGPSVVEHGLEVQIVPLSGAICERDGLGLGIVVDLLAQGVDGDVGEGQLGIEVVLWRGGGTAGLGAGDAVKDLLAVGLENGGVVAGAFELDGPSAADALLCLGSGGEGRGQRKQESVAVFVGELHDG